MVAPIFIQVRGRMFQGGETVPRKHCAVSSILTVSTKIRAWVSLADHLPWEQAHVGSNPTALTIFENGKADVVQQVERSPRKRDVARSIRAVGSMTA